MLHAIVISLHLLPLLSLRTYSIVDNQACVGLSGLHWVWGAGLWGQISASMPSAAESYQLFFKNLPNFRGLPWVWFITYILLWVCNPHQMFALAYHTFSARGAWRRTQAGLPAKLPLAVASLTPPVPRLTLVKDLCLASCGNCLLSSSQMVLNVHGPPPSPATFRVF